MSRQIPSKSGLASGGGNRNFGQILTNEHTFQVGKGRLERIDAAPHCRHLYKYFARSVRQCEC